MDMFTVIPLGLIDMFPKAFGKVVFHSKGWSFRWCRGHCAWRKVSSDANVCNIRIGACRPRQYFVEKYLRWVTLWHFSIIIGSRIAGGDPSDQAI